MSRMSKRSLQLIEASEKNTKRNNKLAAEKLDVESIWGDNHSEVSSVTSSIASSVHPLAPLMPSLVDRLLSSLPANSHPSEVVSASAESAPDQAMLVPDGSQFAIPEEKKDDDDGSEFPFRMKLFPLHNGEDLYEDHSEDEDEVAPQPIPAKHIAPALLDDLDVDVNEAVEMDVPAADDANHEAVFLPRDEDPDAPVDEQKAFLPLLPNDENNDHYHDIPVNGPVPEDIPGPVHVPAPVDAPAEDPQFEPQQNAGIFRGVTLRFRNAMATFFAALLGPLSNFVTRFPIFVSMLVLLWFAQTRPTYSSADIICSIISIIFQIFTLPFPKTIDKLIATTNLNGFVNHIPFRVICSGCSTSYSLTDCLIENADKTFSSKKCNAVPFKFNGLECNTILLPTVRGQDGKTKLRAKSSQKMMYPGTHHIKITLHFIYLFLVSMLFFDSKFIPNLIIFLFLCDSVSLSIQDRPETATRRFTESSTYPELFTPLC